MAGTIQNNKSLFPSLLFVPPLFLHAEKLRTETAGAGSDFAVKS